MTKTQGAKDDSFVKINKGGRLCGIRGSCHMYAEGLRMPIAKFPKSKKNWRNIWRRKETMD